jgi:hypothetical protein
LAAARLKRRYPTSIPGFAWIDLGEPFDDYGLHADAPVGTVWIVERR